MVNRPKRSAVADTREARRAAVANLLRAGWDQRSIARTLQGTYKASLTTVHEDIKVLRRRWREDAIADIQASAALDLHRIDVLMRVFMPLAAEGDTAAADKVMQLITKRGDILGYREAARINLTVTGFGERPAEVVDGVSPLMAAMANPELRKALEQVRRLSRTDIIEVQPGEIPKATDTDMQSVR